MKRLMKLALLGAAAAGVRNMAKRRTESPVTIDARQPQRGVQDMQGSADFPGGVRP